MLSHLLTRSGREALRTGLRECCGVVALPATDRKACSREFRRIITQLEARVRDELFRQCKHDVQRIIREEDSAATEPLLVSALRARGVALADASKWLCDANYN